MGLDNDPLLEDTETSLVRWGGMIHYLFLSKVFSCSESVLCHGVLGSCVQA